jgi:hypothetical protein
MARPAVHLLVSTGLATYQWIRTGRLAPTLAPLVTGFLIDGDHLVDHVRYHRSGKTGDGRVILPLHGWEYVPLLLLVERLLGWRLAGGLTLGYLGHLGVDQFTNDITHPLTYSLSFRWLQGFPSLLFAHPSEREVDWMQHSIFELWKHF